MAGSLDLTRNVISPPKTIPVIIQFIATLLLAAVLGGCDDSPPVVDLDQVEVQPVLQHKAESGAIRIAVGAMVTPKEGFHYYREFIDYIGRKTGQPMEYVDRKSYGEINQLLSSGELDVAFVCSGPYVDGLAGSVFQPLAAPRAYGGSVYYSYLIVPKDSEFESLADLRGRSFAFTDPDSNSGTLVPTYMLAGMGESPESFFGEYQYTYAHDKSIKAVALGLVDGAAVDSLVWEYINRKTPERTSGTRIIEKSTPYGIPPVVVRTGLDPQLVEKLRTVFLEADHDPAGRELLKGMMIEKFTPVDDSLYDSVREMKAWLLAHPPERK